MGQAPPPQSQWPTLKGFPGRSGRKDRKCRFPCRHFAIGGPWLGSSSQQAEVKMALGMVIFLHDAEAGAYPQAGSTRQCALTVCRVCLLWTCSAQSQWLCRDPGSRCRPAAPTRLFRASPLTPCVSHTRSPCFLCVDLDSHAAHLKPLLSSPCPGPVVSGLGSKLPHGGWRF